MTLESAFAPSATIEPPVHGCANCGAPAPEAYCPACGQATRERLPTFRQFMREATGRYVAYDGKFWKTLAALLLRPGFLTREYLDGRRRRYIGPARLFLVSSLLLFATLKFATDSIEIGQAIEVDVSKGPRVKVEGSEKAGTTEKRERADAGDFLTLDDDFNLNLSELAGTTGILRKPIARFNSLSRAQKAEQIKAGALRYGPYAMFALLPAMAALLKILYLGRSRRYPTRPSLYGEHLVFATHNHAFLFVAGSLITMLSEGWLAGALATWMFVYLVWATRAVYGGRWLGMVVRATALAFAYLILFAFVTIGLVIAAVLLR